MEANGIFGRFGSRSSGQGASGRRNSILIAAVAALLAAALIYAFVSHYHKSTVLPPAETTVFVSKAYIPPGESEQQIASAGLIKPKRVPISQAIVGAISDPSQIVGTVTASAIAPGQQITIGEFVRGAGALNTQLTGSQRAVAISIDPAHGITAYLIPGNTVDIYAQGKGGTSVLFQNVLVLENQGGDVVLNLSDKQVLLLGDAQQEGLTLWLAIRPATGAKNSVPLGTVEKLP